MERNGSRIVAAALAGLVLGGGVGCAKNPTITLPALETSRSADAEALVVRVEPVAGGLVPPNQVVSGAGEGAKHGMAKYMNEPAVGEAAILWLLLMPVALPISAAVGAGMARSEAEIDEAAAALRRAATDGALAASLDRRLAGVLERERRTGWACVAAESASGAVQPCPGAATVARVVLRPYIRMSSPKGKGFDPKMLLLARVVAEISFEGADERTEPPLKVIWAYRERLGRYFALTADDGALLRSRLDAILDLFAGRIAADLYLDPQPASYRGIPASAVGIPERQVVRIAQSGHIVSHATHGRVAPGPGPCWIAAVDGRPTGQDRYTTWHEVPVKAGPARVEVACVRFSRTPEERIETVSIELDVEAGAAYFTDGRTVSRR